MQTKPDFLTVKELVELKANGMARVNPEYQRGEVWRPDQQMKLIDSLMRGYQLPIIYLHYKRTEAGGLTGEYYDIIDGQQRINAFHYFTEGAYSLYAPDDPKARFPRFLHSEPCPWGGKRFSELPEDLQTQLLETKIPVAYITTDSENEVRDLFVRLQSGFPLNSQEKRDSHPGWFTDYILGLGGKPDVPKYPGHDFFQEVLGMRPRVDRGKTRQLAAQIAMLFHERRQEGPEHFVDIHATAIDDYYYRHLDFDTSAPDCRRLNDILGKLSQLLADRSGPRLKGHDAMHLVLFLDSIWDDYTRSWESGLRQATEQFSAELARASQLTKVGQEREIWSQYGIWTRSGADRGENIGRRHRYYSERMREYLGNLTLKDPRRSYGRVERELIFWNDGKICQVCDAEVLWSEAEIHHLIPHSEGGRTDLANGALVHKHCHPKTVAETEALAAKVVSRRGVPS